MSLTKEELAQDDKLAALTTLLEPLGEVEEALQRAVSLLTDHLSEAVAVTNAGQGHLVKSGEWLLTKDTRNQLQEGLTIVRKLREVK